MTAPRFKTCDLRPEDLHTARQNLVDDVSAGDALVGASAWLGQTVTLAEFPGVVWRVVGVRAVGGVAAAELEAPGLKRITRPLSACQIQGN